MALPLATKLILSVLSIQCGEVLSLTHLREPVIRWRTQLGLGTIASAGLKRKNELALSHDGSRLYASLDDGSLSVLDTVQGEVLFTFAPPPSSLGWSVSNIESGASISSSSGDLVYAVQDSPPPFRWNGTFWYQYEGWFATGIYNNSQITKVKPDFYPEPVETSRIISLDYKGALRWMYTLNGFVVGTPIYGDQEQADGSKLVYVLHNVNNVGQFTILIENSNGTGAQVLYNEVSKGGMPFSPMTKLHSQRGEDVLYWVSTMNAEPGYDPRGRLYRVIVRQSLQIISSNARHEYVGAATRPLLSRDGTSIWVAGAYSRLYKLNWQANASMWKGTVSSALDWEFQMDASLRNETMPVMASPTLSSDGQFLFVPSTTTTFYCIHAPSGAEVWKLRHRKRSIYMNEAKLSPDNAIVYSILFMDGTVIAQDAATGSIVWELSCANVGAGADCQDSVEAEFVLSSDGTQLYFGDFKGRIVSLAVAVDNSKSSPSSAAPTQITSAPMSQRYAPHSVSKPANSTHTTVEIPGHKDINNDAVGSISTYPPSGTPPLILKPTTMISTSNPSASSSRGHYNTGTIHASTVLPTSPMKVHQNSSHTLSHPTSLKPNAINTTKCTDSTSLGSGCTQPVIMSPVPGPAAPHTETKTHTNKLIPALIGPEPHFTSLPIKVTRFPSAYSLSSHPSATSTLVHAGAHPSKKIQQISKKPFASPIVGTESLEPFTVDFGQNKPNIHSSPGVIHHQPSELSLNPLPISLPVEKTGSSRPSSTYHNSNKTAQKPIIQLSAQPTVSTLKSHPLHHGQPLLVSQNSFVPSDLSPENPPTPSFGSDSFSTPSMAANDQHVQPVAVESSVHVDHAKPLANARRPSVISTGKWSSEQPLPNYGTNSLSPAAAEMGRNFVDKRKSLAVVPAATASAVAFFIIALSAIGYAAFQMYNSREKQGSDEQQENENEG